jgi:feruloyl esterase
MFFADRAGELGLLLAAGATIGLTGPGADRSAAIGQSPAAASACSTANVSVPGLTARVAPVVALPAAPGTAPPVLPAHCRIVGEVRPVAGSRIGFELWLPPAAAWSGRVVMLGNGGYSSRLPLPALAAELARGSAVVATDTGHQGDDPDFAVGHRQAIADWGWRAVHLTAQGSQRIVARFYGRRAAHRYFNGCSTGGHQAMMEAQRFPGDFDGIVAGAPGANRVTLNAAFLWQYLANHPRGDDSRPILRRDDLSLLQEASFKVCGAANGGSAGGRAGDAWLNDPVACRFDPAVLACRPGQADGCLTPQKLTAARSMYRGASDPRTGKAVTFPWLPGSERGWAGYLTDFGRPAQPARTSFWRVWAFDDPAWSWWSFDFGGTLARVRGTLGPVIDAVSPDLSRFSAHGGKLLQYHGLADPVVSPLDTIAYRRAVAARGPTDRWYRLFLAPGMEHCGGGPGFSRFETQTAIERWVEHGEAPERIVAARGAGLPAATRPLCPFPARAVYRSGPADAAGSYACSNPALPHSAPRT